MVVEMVIEAFANGTIKACMGINSDKTVSFEYKTTMMKKKKTLFDAVVISAFPIISLIVRP